MHFRNRTAVLFVIVCLVPSQTTAQETEDDDLLCDIFGENPEENKTPEAYSPTPQEYRAETTPTEDCECVDYYLCNNGLFNKFGEDIIDIRIHDCSHYLEVCCAAGNITSTTANPAPPAPPKGCGYRNPNGVGFKIQNALDGESEFGEFPWMVAVYYREDFRGDPRSQHVAYQCGGALIHPQVVLTAAHCVKDPKRKLTIRAGEWDSQTEKEMHPHQDRDVDSIVIHPQYLSKVVHNDVALLFLEQEVVLAPHINVLCLPPQDTVIDEARCFSSGWGRDVFGKEGKPQVILKKVEVPMVPRKQCEDNLRKTRLGKHFQLHRSFVCAGGEEGKDTCKGDGGSPLMCPIQGQTERYFQIGMVAWGIGCGGRDIPGVYVNVPMFRKWIDEQLQIKQLEIDTYQF